MGNVFFKRNFFDTVEAMARGEGKMQFAMGSGIAMAMALFLIITLAIQAVSELVYENFSMKIRGYLGKALNNKASQIDLIVYEDNRFLDCINKAYVGLEATVEIVFSTLSIVFKEVAYFIFMGTYFFSIKQVLLIMFGISANHNGCVHTQTYVCRVGKSGGILS